MTAIAELHREHIALAAHAASIEAPLQPSAPEAERLRRSLGLFRARLDEHFAHEDPVLDELCAMPSGSPLRLAGEARRREARALAETTQTGVAHWTRPGLIERDARGFAAAWSVLRDALARLVAREEGEVYPLTAAAGWQPRPVLVPPPTGIRELDEDHEEVFALIGGLRAALGGGQTAVDGSGVAALAAYAERHFAREESLMEGSTYPGLDDHRREHHRARAILMGFRNDHLDGRRVDSTVVLQFLEGWLLSHIGHADQRMVLHLRQCGRLPG
ncbi:MAG: hemerythrin family protein [Planctomycetes bacterium]|nr:hemerythrin family protein [Planctomycetota bacterium]